MEKEILIKPEDFECKIGDYLKKEKLDSEIVFIEEIDICEVDYYDYKCKINENIKTLCFVTFRKSKHLYSGIYEVPKGFDFSKAIKSVNNGFPWAFGVSAEGYSLVKKTRSVNVLLEEGGEERKEGFIVMQEDVLRSVSFYITKLMHRKTTETTFKDLTTLQV